MRRTVVRNTVVAASLVAALLALGHLTVSVINPAERSLPALAPGAVAGDVIEVSMGDETWRFRPSRELLADGGRVCLAFQTGSSGGEWCYVAGWAVETHAFHDGGRSVLVGITVPEAAKVTLPGENGRLLDVTPEVDEALGVGVFTVIPEDGFVATGRNDIAAYAADGTKLGNEHNRTVDGDYGPWDGTLDQGMKPPSTPPNG